VTLPQPVFIQIRVLPPASGRKAVPHTPQNICDACHNTSAQVGLVRGQDRTQKSQVLKLAEFFERRWLIPAN
jgi:hypothetical protein